MDSGTAEIDIEAMDFATASAMLLWQYDLGATEAMLDAPLNRYELAEKAPVHAKPVVQAEAAPLAAGPPDPARQARMVAEAAGSLAALQDAVAGFDLCELKRGARATVFADGNAAARVMVIGDVPDRDEDREGRPFAGQAGVLLDRMFAAIGMARDAADPGCGIYLTTVMPWHAPQYREPTEAELAMTLPFVQRHIELAGPEVIVLMGNAACQGLLGQGSAARLRGVWAEVMGIPALPMVHPAGLLRNPAAKREAWADLLTLQARLRG